MSNPTSRSAEPGDAASIERHSPEARSLGFSGQDPLFARGLEDGRIIVREGREGEQRRILTGNGAAVTSLAFSPDGVYLASGFQDGTIRLWEPRSGREMAARRDHTSPVDTFKFSQDGSLLASWGRDSRMLLYDVPGARTFYDLTALASDVNATHWLWVIAPVKTNEQLSSGITGGSEASGPRQDLWAMTARSPLSEGPASLEWTTEDVTFRPARIYAETEYAEASTTRSLDRSEIASDATEQADAALRLQDTARGRLSMASTTRSKILRQAEGELVVAVTLSLELPADFRDTSLKTLLFRLSPCAAGNLCPAPELTLSSPQKVLV